MFNDVIRQLSVGFIALIMTPLKAGVNTSDIIASTNKILSVRRTLFSRFACRRIHYMFNFFSTGFENHFKANSIRLTASFQTESKLLDLLNFNQIGRASCRERVCQYV
jgi:hypothetical protein